MDWTGEDYWSTSNPDEINKFWTWLSQNGANATGSYTFLADAWFRMCDEEFIEAYSLYGQRALTYNDQTNKLYSSYVTYENNEFVVNGVSVTAHTNSTIALSKPIVLTGTPSFLPGFKSLKLGKNILSILKIFKNKQVSKKVVEKAITFGQNENQVYHTFRHIDKLNISRDVVRKIIMNDLKKKQAKIVENIPFNQIIQIGKHRLQYTAFKLPNGKINIGRIHEVK